MPNHIQNKLTVAGNGYKDVLKSIKGTEKRTDDDSYSAIDFNKIIPMPKELHITAGGRIENMIKNTLKMPNHSNPLIAMLETLNREKTESPLDLTEQEWKEFIQGLNNVRQYGVISWYGWANQNWSTKWNAYQTPDNRDTKDTIHFQTAWACPFPIIVKLSEMFPQNEFIIQWADENTGSNSGLATFKNGEQIKGGYFDNSSKEAYENAFELNPENKEYYKLVNGKYEYVDED